MSDSQQEDTSDSETEPVEQLDDDEQWELLNAQKDVLLHLHTQTIRFVQIFLTLIGLVFTMVALFGLDSITAVFSLANLRTARGTIALWPWFYLVIMIAIHVIWVLLKILEVFMTVATRVALLGLTVHPIVGRSDQTEIEGGKSEWITSNHLTLTNAEDELSDAYTSLFWLVIHLLLVVILYHGTVYQHFTLLYGIGGSMATISWVGVLHTFPDDHDHQQRLFENGEDKRPHRWIWFVFEDRYERSIAETDSEWVARWRFLTYTWYFLLLIPHFLFFVSVIP